MKKIIDYIDEIHKCSKCGLCQSVCPVYKVTGNDCAVSRGKFIMLNGIIKGDLELNNNINKYLDMCLKCNACSEFCPSGIDAREIFLAAKGEYFGKAGYSGLLKVLNSPPVFNSLLNCVKMASSTYRFFKIDKFAKIFYPILRKIELGKKAILANELFSTPTRHAELDSASCRQSTLDRSRNEFGMTQGVKVVYFKGCVNEYVNPRTAIAGENVLRQMGVNVLSIDFNCCGVPFLSLGNLEQFKKQAEYNLNKIPDDFDFFLTDCASCQGAFKDYENYIDDEKLLEKLKKINGKSVNIVDFVVQNAKSFEFSQGTSFTFHKPCHLEDMNFLQEFLSKAKNVEYIEMQDYNICCGFAGAFALNNPEISAQISKQKAKKAFDTNADYIVTSCPSCVLGLTQGLIEAKCKMQNAKSLDILNFIEFLNNCKISL